MEPVRVLQFTDVLCVWAYVAQIRIDRLQRELGSRLVVDGRFCSVFGDAHTKLSRRWADRGGFAAYGAHVRHVAEGFDHVQVHPEVWSKVVPRSSLACHLFLCAIRHAEATSDGGIEAGTYARACWAARVRFFRDLEDIGDARVQFGLAEELGVSRAAIEDALASGAAHAALAADYDLAREYDIKVSPSLVLNDGRQRLNGNVGYRVIEANVREMLHRAPTDAASWC